jgi:hypothetical protein
MLVALVGTSYGASSVQSASSATLTSATTATPVVASAPQSFPPSQPCPAQGDGQGDPALTVEKNRFTGPSLSDISSDIATPANIINLAQPSELKPMEQRASWPNDTAVNQLKTREGQAVTIVGYLVGAKEENTGGGESCNCHKPQVLFDYHLYMADQPGVPIAKAVVVEMTPRWRAVNPSWGTADNSFAGFTTIKGLVNQQVRVTGWLLFDEEHLNQVGVYRATVWEIHPVTTFEYQKGGNWVKL